ncbi:MAG TPA: ROK family protein [Thermoleophilaceae bacterium]|nr:ROK family protein [Thermoleophilaceae bacterium]
MSDISELSVGVDVGGTKIAAAAISGTSVVERHERPTVLDPAAIVGEIEAAARAVIDAAPGPVAAVGVGVPSQVHFATGRVMASVNIPLQGVELRQELGARLGLPVFVDNDGNCAALAEAFLAQGGRARHLVMYTMGTGVGGGVVIDGQVFRGATGLGAELGHAVIQADGPECPGNCPNHGCMEALCSGLALERDATALGRERPDSPLGQIVAAKGRVTGRDTVAAAREGDPDAGALLERLGTWLGVGIANAINTFEPEWVAIGGGLSAAAEFFFGRAVEEATSRALPESLASVRIAIARGGPAAGVIGAGLLASQEYARATRDTQTETASEGVL